MEKKNENGVQKDVGEGTGQVCHHAFLSRSVCPDQVQKDSRKDGHGSEADKDAKIVSGKSQGRFIGPQEGAEGIHEKKCGSCKGKAQKEGAVEAESGDLSGLFMIPAAQGQGDDGTAAGSEKCAKARKDRKDRACQAYGGDHVGISQSADKEDVCHVVEDHDYHDHDGRQAEVDKKRCIGSFPQKELIFVFIRIHV